MAIIDALIPSASADVVAIFPEAGGIDLPDIGQLPSFIPPNFAGLIPREIPGFIPVQVFGDARPMRAQVSEPSRFMVHPLESGAQVTDHRIVLPVEVSITFILRPETYRITYQLIRQAYLVAQRFSIQTKTSTYTGMYIEDLPHEEDPAFFDTVTMVVVFREVQFFPAQAQQLSTSDVINPQDASTALRGEQIPRPASAEQDSRGSTLFRVFGGLL